MQQDYEAKNRRKLGILRKQLNLENFSWNFKEADLYRRRPFPIEFLHNEISKYPCYVFQSSLSKAYNKIATITIEVDISEFESKFKPIMHEESLVTSTNELIRNILRKVYDKHRGYKIKDQIHENNNLILKANGYREYFEGNYQLL